MEYNKYNHSYVYKLCCNDTEIKDCYIGSTINPARRIAQHKVNCKNYKNTVKHNYAVYKFIREHGGWCNWKMSILEQANLNTFKELSMLERKYYEAEPNHTLNSNYPGLTSNESKKEWTKKNPEYIKEYQEANREKLSLYNKEWTKKNRDRINENLREKKKCYCGATVTKGNMYRHIKTKKHLDFVTSMNL